MKVNGVIAEYNPFHNGHRYHLSRIKEETGADYNIVVLSSNFTQRGEPAIIDKFVRAKMALENGADLVLELPVSHSCSSAEYFAQGGVSILNQLGVVDHLCFGSESGNITVLTEIADILIRQPDSYKNDLQSGLAAGHSFPAARNRALTVCKPELAQNESLLSSPNNILAIEYIKALISSDSTIKPFTIQRAGEGYHSRRFGQNFCSALALRQVILEGRDLSILSEQMPHDAYDQTLMHLSQTPPICVSDFSNMLLYKLLMEQDFGFDRYVDVTTELSDRIRNSLKHFEGYAEFCNLLKSKNMTYTRISRSLLHILLDMKDEDFLMYREVQEIPYARVLGFRKDAQPLLTEIKNHSSIPLITKLADAPNLLSTIAMTLLVRDLRRGSIYEGIAARKSGRPARDERQIPIVIV